MTTKQIQTIGNFLTYYRNDLNYIKQFQDFKTGKISFEDYLKKDAGSFYSFLVDFRVVRNFPRGTVNNLLEETSSWIKTNDRDNVDLFAENLREKELTHGKIMASMASKILFLNNPWQIVPMDTLARKTLEMNQNKYFIYNKKINEFRKENKPTFEILINYIKPLSLIIHQEFEDIENLDLICENRMVDKLLWTTGK
ncbi:hypothetical protein [Flavobacterium sp. UBA7682]|uniref:hypothetical protein n=1 Tax=Flavobacterium sp. UBA7682 TaxID=1946560 RepID=UPI0025BCA91B|nr:hypothetical protein [Flavobacterium sp. UBA7682]